MDAPITINSILTIIGVLIAFESLLKAIEWGISKITASHDKSQKIDENHDSLEEYKAKTDKAIKELQQGMKDAHQYASDSLNSLDESITGTLKEHKDEYFERIKSVENSILEMQAVYQQTVAIVDVKIENLTKQVEKHNRVVERTFALEKDVAVLQQRETASEKRIRELEEDDRK